MTLFFQSPKQVKSFVKSKSKEEHIEYLNKLLKMFAKQYEEIQAGENAKQGYDWRQIENEIILRSRIIACTLAISGAEKLDIVKDKVDYLIIDEAC